MQELNMEQIEAVSGGEMSTTTKVVIGGALVVAPVVGLGMLLGYYSNVQ